MGYFVNSAATSDALTRELRELVPAPEMRRRMGRLLRMAVATGMEALAALPEGTEVDAIITATRLGCLADSERFLRGVTEGGLLNPTPFILSTFNTVGAQIALLTGNHGYNTTYVHGEESLAAALVDAQIRIDQAGARHVLVGLFDEATPTLERVKGRMRGVHGLPGRDGARFWVLSAEPLEGCLGEVAELNELLRW
jgi:3-oxoacyl-(acyl-carrier-protein) synthase